MTKPTENYKSLKNLYLYNKQNLVSCRAIKRSQSLSVLNIKNSPVFGLNICLTECKNKYQAKNVSAQSF